MTPNLKGPETGKCSYIVFVDLSNGQSRIGGTALAQVYKSLGDQVPDVQEPDILKKAFIVTQNLIAGGLAIKITNQIYFNISMKEITNLKSFLLQQKEKY